MAAPRHFAGIPVHRDIGTSPLPASSDVPVVVVGGGPVGLTVALDLGRRGHRVAVLNRLPFVAGGSKAICFAKRTLDIWDRLGVGGQMVEHGVIWNVGKVFRGASTEQVYAFDMLPIKQQHRPGFVNLQQYHVEGILIDALSALPNVELCWGHEVVGVAPDDDGVTLNVKVDDQAYQMRADWVLACDGTRSPVRGMLGLDFEGRVFEDNFLIADIRMQGEHPLERWFWFDPPFNPGRSALLHKQPDDIWRLDFQLGRDVDRKACIRPENVAPFIRGMLGPDVEFTPEWYSVYTFQCRRMSRFVHGRVILAGDSAHLVSPFGARGCNGGVADADNLGWKLDLVLRGLGGAGLLESYNHEAIATADENILNSTRSTDFLSPASPASRALRDAVLALARDHAFARPFVNSGRLSTAVAYPDSPLSTPDTPGDVWQGVPPGAAAVDAPIGGGWLLEALAGGSFVLLTAGARLPLLRSPLVLAFALEDLEDPDGLVAERYDLSAGSAYLFRPDQYIAARWRNPTAEAVDAAIFRATGGAL